MTRNPKMKKLRHRLTPEQLEARAADLEVRSVWRQKMARIIAQNRGGINTCSQGIEMVYKKHRLTRRLVYGSMAGQALYIAARYFGYLVMAIVVITSVACTDTQWAGIKAVGDVHTIRLYAADGHVISEWKSTGLVECSQGGICSFMDRETNKLVSTTGDIVVFVQ